MQEQNQQQDQQATPSAQLAADVNRAETLFMVWSNPDGAITTKGIVKAGQYQPEHVASHAYLHAVQNLHSDIMASINGKPTDGDRFRALRDFAALANTDKERFELVNGMILKYETEGDLPAEKERTVADYVKMADFLCFALAETEPVLTAPTSLPEVEAPKIAMPHGVARPTYQ